MKSKVTVVGAGNVGASCAVRLAADELAALLKSAAAVKELVDVMAQKLSGPQPVGW